MAASSINADSALNFQSSYLRACGLSLLARSDLLAEIVPLPGRGVFCEQGLREYCCEGFYGFLELPPPPPLKPVEPVESRLDATEDLLFGQGVGSRKALCHLDSTGSMGSTGFTLSIGFTNFRGDARGRARREVLRVMVQQEIARHPLPRVALKFNGWLWHLITQPDAVAVAVGDALSDQR
jgi:hypothetical protein